MSFFSCAQNPDVILMDVLGVCNLCPNPTQPWGAPATQSILLILLVQRSACTCPQSQSSTACCCAQQKHANPRGREFQVASLWQANWQKPRWWHKGMAIRERPASAWQRGCERLTAPEQTDADWFCLFSADGPQTLQMRCLYRHHQRTNGVQLV